MKAREPKARGLFAVGLGVGISLAAASALAQGASDEERTLADEIPDVEIPDVEIEDVEIPDVLIGQNDAVLDEEEAPPPVAIFEDPTQPEPAVEEPTAAVDESVAPAGERVTGNISAIDLEDGTLEIDTDTQGTLRLSADRARLRQIAPGQSVSLSYVDRDDGRWVAELEALPSPLPVP